jgi:hypothetical protein
MRPPFPGEPIRSAAAPSPFGWRMGPWLVGAALIGAAALFALWWRAGTIIDRFDTGLRIENHTGQAVVITAVTYGG